LADWGVGRYEKYIKRKRKLLWKNTWKTDYLHYSLASYSCRDASRKKTRSILPPNRWANNSFSERCLPYSLKKTPICTWKSRKAWVVARATFIRPWSREISTFTRNTRVQAGWWSWKKTRYSHLTNYSPSYKKNIPGNTGWNGLPRTALTMLIAWL